MKIEIHETMGLSAFDELFGRLIRLMINWNLETIKHKTFAFVYGEAKMMKMA